VSSDALMELSARTNSLESQLSSTKQEKSKLTAELEMAKLRMATLEDEKNRYTLPHPCDELSDFQT